MILIEIHVTDNMVEDFEYFENKYLQLKQMGIFTSKIISEYGFDSDEGISVTDMYAQALETFKALYYTNTKSF